MQVKSINKFLFEKTVLLLVDNADGEKKRVKIHMQIERGISRTYVLQTHILVYRFI